MDERSRQATLERHSHARSAVLKTEDAGLRGLADVAVVQAADFGTLHDLARRGELDRPEVGCVLVEREMGARLMVIGEVAGQDAAQVSFAEDEDVIQTLAPDRTDEALGERILPRAVRRRENFLDPHALHAVPERLAIDLVTIAEEVGRRGVVREGVDDLLGGPGGGGMLGDVEVDDAPAMVGEHDEDEQHAQARGGHGEEIDGDQVPDMVGRGTSARSGTGGGRRFGIRRDTVRSATSMPSFRSSPWIRGAPHRGFAAAIRVTRALISALTGGRPPVGRPESLVQYSRKRRRCHRRTVSGVTITRGCLHPAQTLASRPRRGDPSGEAWAESSFSCTRRAAGARRGSPGRAGGGRRRGTGGVGAGGAGG